MDDPKVTVPLVPAAQEAVKETPWAFVPLALLVPLILMAPVVLVTVFVLLTTTPIAPLEPPGALPPMLIVPFGVEIAGFAEEAICTPTFPDEAVLEQVPIKVMLPDPVVFTWPTLSIKMPQFCAKALDNPVMEMLPPEEERVELQ